MKQLRDSVIKWLVFSLCCLLFGFLLGNFKYDILDDKLVTMTLALQKVETRNAELEAIQSGLDVVAMTDQQTIKSLMQSNKQLQDELSVANNKLYFYEGVLAPENETTGVKVHSFEVTQNGEKGSWSYELVLVQSQKGRRQLNGQFKIFLSVFEGDTPKEIALSDLNATGEGEFRFKYFQTIKGAFELPSELSVDQIILKLGVKGTRWHKAQNVEERFDWRVLTTGDTGDLSEFDLNEGE